MDVVRFGLQVRALRRRRHWTQQRLADEAGLSRSAIARIEQGHGDRVAVRTLIRVVSALGARVQVRLLWHGEGIDRLLDARHAGLLELSLRLLTRLGWEAATEVSFNEFGDRGSIDILAFHRPTGSLLVIEIKTVVPDLQAMLGTLDRKARVSRRLARERGWTVTSVSRLIVFPDDRTVRRRVAEHAATFSAALPARTVAARRWLSHPVGDIAGILFLSDDTLTSTRHRVASAKRGTGRDSRSDGERPAIGFLTTDH